MATEKPYRAGKELPPFPDEGPTEVKTKRVIKKEDATKSTPKTESRRTGDVFRAEMLEKFGGKMKEPPMPDEGPTFDPESVKEIERINKEARPLRMPRSPLIMYAKGGSTASKRADGCAQRGKTKGKML